jgi:hypothetical protein
MVDTVEKYFFRHPGKQGYDKRADKQSKPETACQVYQGITKIASHHKKSAVRKIHEVQKAKNDGQPHGDEKVNHPQAQTVQQLKNIQHMHPQL